ncbi:hypothetical protein B8W96_10825 [Lentilactobacillus parakefiri]|uniref:restriction endonuclease subunit S n=1 Tax=Lentilactobacillus TaxID=2767893 RepID=UPI000BA5BCF1|nr:restriction endonuclease subunit S [Lentilactobacillus parakefiri]PAK99576.1 hypothetical protein B8W96_10825 [Lentilactobacillus parakefiri]
MFSFQTVPSHVGTISHYTLIQVEKTPIILPCKNEQGLIGKMLKNLDQLIAANQRKVEKLKELKKGYMQKMFC